MASMARKRPQKIGERGQALLELVPVMLLLLTLTFAVIDFSRAIWQLEVITGLTREGSNLASRRVSLAASAAAVVSDGKAVLNADSSDVIITSVQNVANPGEVAKFQIMDQTSIGNLKISDAPPVSRIGTGKGSLVQLPTTDPVVPQPGGTIYVTEIYSSFSPITPLGSFVSYALPSPSTLYDVAYF